MIRFECDYGEGAAQPVLDLLQKTNLEQTPGYGMDDYCDQARGLIRKLCDAPDAGVHFFCGCHPGQLYRGGCPVKTLAGRAVCRQRAYQCT